MKKIIVVAIVCFISNICFSQISTTLFVSAMPPGTLIDWAFKKDILSYIINNQGGPGTPGRQAVIKAELRTTDGTLAGSTNLIKAKVITINPGTLILGAESVIPLDVMVFNGKFKITLDKTGKLPAGGYQLCVQLLTPIDFIPLVAPACRSFTLAAFQLPIPVMPSNEMLLDLEKANTAITFRWTPVAPTPNQPPIYRVTVFEILPDQTPMQALRSNQPLLAKDISGTTQYIWQPQLGLTKCCKDRNAEGAEKNINTSEAGVGTGKDQKIMDNSNEPDAYAFIWTIQTFDRQGRPFGDGNVNGDGISEPVIFFVDRRPASMKRSGPPSRTIFLNNMKGKRN